MRGRGWRRGVLGAAAVLAPMPGMAPAASADPAGAAENTISKALTEWKLAFNAGDTGAVCGLFAPELRYDIRGFPERGFEEVCACCWDRWRTRRANSPTM